LMMRDRAYGDDGARKGMIAILDTLGDHAMVAQWRRKMANTLL
ncbi:MAG: tetratricopeptide repeat protein, partial [Gammaproteobacteria bacterium]|nr:tetratricopeptide repeat protein [Gammaproteobacteria bacterium]